MKSRIVPFACLLGFACSSPDPAAPSQSGGAGAGGASTAGTSAVSGGAGAGTGGNTSGAAGNPAGGNAAAGMAGLGGISGSAGASGAGGVAGGATNSERWPGCHSIFDGETFDGWESTKGWSIEGGALHSLGAGRGQIGTKKDYKAFRWIFSMRHQPGDHNPCVLVWGHGHEGDAFGGSIQIQAPTCNGWDYRAGHNNALPIECPKPQPTIDKSKWTQCEILTHETGKLRMACCQLGGDGDEPCRGVENLRFEDATAPVLGPIGYQMHNAGLFDEFKDICIEENPASAELLTTQ